MWAQWVAWLATSILAGVILLQVALVAGAPLGHLAWGGQERTLPTKLKWASSLSALFLAAIAWIILIHGHVIERAVPYDWTRIALWIFVVQFALNTVANLSSKSIAEKLIMSPLTAVLAAFCLALALFA